MSSPLSLTGKNWNVNNILQNEEIINSLAKSRGISLTHTLTWGDLANPMTLGEMSRAVERIRLSFEKNERIGIIGDYDADGITGTAQLVRLFMRHGIDPVVILPHREKDGYGVKKEFIDDFHRQGVTLFLTVDTGISHADEVAHAKTLGMDVIITDHHTPHGDIPDAIIVHPSHSEPHTNPHLAGSGVAFTLIRAVENDDWSGKEEDIALAAIGTVGDVMQLIGENRVIVQLGLAALQNGNNAPVYDLARSILKNGETLTSTHIGFRIAPRINAAGRLADPMIALHALLEGGSHLTRLQTLNTERQEATRRMMEIAETLVTDTPLIILRSAAFHAGIIGLIAGRITEKYGKPTLVASEAGEELTCSLRSIPEYHITNALERCNEHLMTFGGHAAAAGCTVHSSKWNEFCSELLADTTHEYGDLPLSPTITIDAVLNPSQCSLSFVKKLQKLEPFGAGNSEPRFLLQNQQLTNVRSVGKESSHLQCHVGGIKAIGFGLGRLMEELPDNVDIVCRLGIDTWGGTEKVQLFVEDMRVSISEDEQGYLLLVEENLKEEWLSEKDEDAFKALQ